MDVLPDAGHTAQHTPGAISIPLRRLDAEAGQAGGGLQIRRILLDGIFEPNEEIFAASGREVRRLKRLAADFANLSRAEEGSQPLELETVDLN